MVRQFKTNQRFSLLHKRSADHPLFRLNVNKRRMVAQFGYNKLNCFNAWIVSVQFQQTLV